jgi:hypothetical protein
MTCHTSLHQSELVADHLGTPDAEVKARGRIVSEAYRSVDRAIGELRAAFGAGHVLVLSDHGFDLERPRPGDPRYYGHRDAPRGVFILHGPDVRHGRVRGLGVYDVLPLAAYLKGIPVSDELRGRVPAAVLRPGLLEERPPHRVPAYPRRVPMEGPVGDGADAEMLERLRALGYLQ